MTYQDDPLRHLRQSQRRGDLRIYLGAAPGVGKTCAMLGEAHRRLERGTDVVAAGRGKRTAARRSASSSRASRSFSAALHLLSRGAPSPNSTSRRCCDVSRKVALVDEYAHSNIPGSTHEKRWQDIETLLDAGINRDLDA